jgi:hypothetical protein
VLVQTDAELNPDSSNTVKLFALQISLGRGPEIQFWLAINRWSNGKENKEDEIVPVK